jgi:hypothetical protein
MTNLFTAHPAAAGQSYFMHMLSAFGVTVRLLMAAIAAFLHAVFPFAFQKVASGVVEDLHGEIMRGRARTAELNPAPAPQP